MKKLIPFSGIDAPALTTATDGSRGTNRSPVRCKIDLPSGEPANTDADAVAAWLTRATNPHTRREYRKEIERFMLWCLVERHKPLSSASVADAQDYKRFLSDPQPADRWIGPRRPRGPEWKPFEKPLNPASVRQAMVIVGNCFQWLVKVRYLDYDVFDEDIVAIRQDRTTIQTDRNLPMRALLRLTTWLTEQPDSPQVIRWRFTVPFLVMTGLRREELVTARMGQFQEHVTAAGERMWHLAVTGKGNKDRLVAVPRMHVVTAYRRHLKLFELPLPGEMHPVWTPLRGHQCATPSALDRDFRIMAHRAGDAIAQLAEAAINPDERAVIAADAALIRRTSPHWLRHVHGTQAVNSGSVPLTMVKDNMGHASMDTTLIYSHTDLENTYRAMSDWVAGVPFLR